MKIENKNFDGTVIHQEPLTHIMEKTDLCWVPSGTMNV